MAKGQMRSNKEKKKPKQDKNLKKGGEAPSPFAGMHSQSKPANPTARSPRRRRGQRRGQRRGRPRRCPNRPRLGSAWTSR